MNNHSDGLDRLVRGLQAHDTRQIRRLLERQEHFTRFGCYPEELFERQHGYPEPEARGDAAAEIVRRIWRMVRPY